MPVETLRRIVGDRHVLTRSSELLVYENDALPGYHQRPSVVVLPGTADEVVAVMGQPESSSHSPGRSCSVYTVAKDFWSRTPWSLSDRYYICFTDGKVDTFRRADQVDVKTSQRQ